MTTIRHTATLFHYDGDQVFEGRDAIGGHYICVLTDCAGNMSEYAAVGVTPEALRDFRIGSLDLRSLMLDAPLPTWYRVKMTDGFDEPLVLVPQDVPIEESEALPDVGFVLHERPPHDDVVREARERNNLVVVLSTEPPESATRPGIRMDTLIGVLTYVRAIVRYAYRKTMRDLHPGAPFNDQNLLNVVVPASAGSFRVFMEASKLPSLFGHRLAPALREMDALFGHVGDTSAAIEAVRARRGHFAGAYLKLLDLLVKQDTPFNYSWAEPESDTSENYGVSPTEAAPLVQVLSHRTSLTSVQEVVDGAFQRFHRGTGSWGLRTADGDVIGKTRNNNPSLDGLVVGGSYRFHCEKEITSIDATGKEHHTLFLKDYEET